MDHASIKQQLDRIAKLARMAAPSANASANEREVACTQIVAIAAAVMDGLVASPPPPPPADTSAQHYCANEFRRQVPTAKLPRGWHDTFREYARTLGEDAVLDAIAITASKVSGGSVNSAGAYYYCRAIMKNMQESAA